MTASHMIKNALATVAGLCCLCVFLRTDAAVPDAFKSINNALGSADRQGCYARWEELDKLALGNGLELPLNMVFNSDQRHCSESCIGYGWWFPLLESTVSQLDETTVVMQGPGGYPFYFIKDLNNLSTYTTKDWKFTGHQQGERDFEVEGVDGWKLTFHKGRLTRAVSPGADVLYWRYDGPRATGISSQRFGEVLKAEYDPKTSLLSRFEYGNNHHKIELKYDKVPVIAEIAANLPAITQVVLSLAEIVAPEARTTFAIEVDDELTKYNLKRGQAVAHENPITDTASWGALDRLLLSDTTSQYHIEGPKGAWDHAKIEQTRNDKSRHSYSFDPNTGILRQEQVDPANGSGASQAKERVTQYILTPGNSFGAISRVWDQLQDGGRTEFLHNYFDSKGHLIRAEANSGYLAIPSGQKRTGNIRIIQRYDVDSTDGASQPLPDGVDLVRSFDRKQRLICECSADSIIERVYSADGSFSENLKKSSGLQMVRKFDKNGQLTSIGHLKQ